MAPTACRMFSTRFPQVSRAILRPPGRRLTAVSPETELEASAITAEPELRAVSASLETEATISNAVSPVPGMLYWLPVAHKGL
jgi:hypothetical protein